MANEDTLEIIVSLKNLTEAGFARLDNQIAGVNNRVKESQGHFTKLGSILSGIGMGIGMAAFGAIETGLGKVVGVLEDSEKAYQDAQVSQSKLGVALQNNIKGFDGNTDAIKRSITANLQLGFSADDQRDSLALLVGATKDVGKAQAAEAAAMDLARLKGVSLSEATATITAAMGGRTAALKKLGIQVEKGASQEQILLDVEKVAAGQANAYADTTAGKEAAAHAKVTEAMVKLGSITDKIVTAAMPALVDAFGNIMDAVGPLLDQIGANMPMYIHMAGEAFDWLSVNILPKLQQAFNVFVTNVLPAIGDALAFFAANILPTLVDAFNAIVDFVVHTLGPAIIEFVKAVWPTIAQAFQVFVHDIMPPVIATLQKVADFLLHTVAPAVSTIVKTVLPPLSDFFTNIVVPAIQRTMDLFGQLADAVSKAVAIAMAVLQPFADLVGVVADGMDRLTSKGTGTLMGGGSGIKGITATPVGAQGGSGLNFGGKSLGGFNTGGIVPGPKGMPMLAVVHGGEAFGGAAAGSTGGGTNLHFHFNSTFPPSPQMARDLVDAIEPEMGRRFGRTSSSLGFGFGG